MKEYKSRAGSGALGRTNHCSGDQTTRQSETRAQVISRKPKCWRIEFLKVSILGLPGILALVRLAAGACGKPDGTMSRYPVPRILSSPPVLSPFSEASTKAGRLIIKSLQFESSAPYAGGGGAQPVLPRQAICLQG